jgi:hypothetical protein
MITAIYETPVKINEGVSQSLSHTRILPNSDSPSDLSES